MEIGEREMEVMGNLSSGKSHSWPWRSRRPSSHLGWAARSPGSTILAEHRLIAGEMQRQAIELLVYQPAHFREAGNKPCSTPRFGTMSILMHILERGASATLRKTSA